MKNTPRDLSFSKSRGAALFYGDALCQIPGLVHVQALGDADIVAQQLQGDYCQAGGKVGIGFGDVEDDQEKKRRAKVTGETEEKV